MTFLKSLICFEGHDNGRRFLAVFTVLYLLLLVFLPLLKQAGILVLLLLVLTTPISLASSIRRINDAGFIRYLAGVPVSIYWLNVLGLVYFDHNAKWLLFLLAVLSTLIISTIRNIKIRHNHQYIFGYYGPINSDEIESDKNLERVEPTIATSVFEGLGSNPLEPDEEYNKQNNIPANQESLEIHSFKEQFLHWFTTNKNLAISGIVITLIGFATIFLESESDLSAKKDPNSSTKELKATQFKKERLHKLEMPDNFWLMLDQNNALTIGWEGDFKKDGSYWSAMTGKGDKTCTDLHFSLGQDFRALEVTVKASEDYYADFSPVDTQLIIKSIADKDRFKLCGYEFVLKGTRSLLRKHEHYRDFIIN